MKHPLLQLIIVHMKEFLREPGSVFWSFGFPVLMALGLGMAFSGGKEIINDVALVPSLEKQGAVFDQVLGFGESRVDTLIERPFTTSGSPVRYKFHITDWDKAQQLLKKGMVQVIITEDNNQPVFHADPLNPKSELISLQLEEFFTTGEIRAFEGNFSKIDVKGLRYIDFLIPGLMCMGIMMSVMWGVCYTLIEKRSKKLLRRMVATPMKKYHFLISQWASRVLVSVMEVFILLGFSYFLFDITIQGSVLALALILLAGNFCFFGISILLSSRTANTQFGNGLISLFTTPMMVLSGIFFSYHNFPDWVVSIIKLLPLTKLVDEVRAVMNEGAGLLQVADGILVLGAAGFLCFIAGMRVYKWY